MSVNFTWTNWYLWSRCSPSWQSRQVSFTQVSQYSISGSFGWVGHINERFFDADIAADILSDAAAAEEFAVILSTDTMVCSLVTLTRRCAWAHGSHSHSLQSVQKWLAATFSSQPVQLCAVIVSPSLSPAAGVLGVSGTNMLSIMFDSMLTWRHTEHVTCPSANKHTRTPLNKVFCQHCRPIYQQLYIIYINYIKKTDIWELSHQISNIMLCTSMECYFCQQEAFEKCWAHLPLRAAACRLF